MKHMLDGLRRVRRMKPLISKLDEGALIGFRCDFIGGSLLLVDDPE
jgi:hypothetical protein